MGRGKPVGEEAREIIYNVYLYFTMEAERFKVEDGYFQKVQERVSRATGVSVRFINRLLHEKGKPGSNIFNGRMGYHKRKSEDEDDEECLAKITKIPETEVNDKSISDAEQTSVCSFKKPAMIKVQKILKVQSKPVSRKAQSTESNPHKPTVITRKAQNATTRPAFIKLHPIQQNVVPIPLQKSAQGITPGLALVRLQQVEKNTVPLTVIHKAKVLKPTLKTVHRIQQNIELKTKGTESINKNPAPAFLKIETKTVPIEFDPASFPIKVKSEQKDSDT